MTKERRTSAAERRGRRMPRSGAPARRSATSVDRRAADNATDEQDILAAIRYANENLPVDSRGITATDLAGHVEWAKGPEPRIRRALDRLSTRGVIECNNGRFWKIR